MLTADVRPNRLERARYSILDFVQRHGRGRVGLVAFAGDAFLQCPLTFDYDAFREALMAVDERTIPVPGTDIGRALTEGYQAMDKGTQRKIMVLVTDGEDLEESGVKAARQLGLKGVHVFTIGVGTPAGGRIEAANERGERDFVRDPGGKIVESRLDEGTLRAIAEATKGVYRPLGAVGEGLNAIRWMIESGAGFSDAERVRKTGVERFHFPLAAVVLLLCVESLVGTRRNPRQSEN
jgi:Ca-activated chloride channel family protein